MTAHNADEIEAPDEGDTAIDTADIGAPSPVGYGELSAAFGLGLVEGHRRGFVDVERARSDAASDGFARGRSFYRPTPTAPKGDLIGPALLALVIGVVIGRAVEAKRHPAAVEGAPPAEDPA